MYDEHGKSVGMVIVDAPPPLPPFYMTAPKDSVLTVSLDSLITRTALTKTGIHISRGKKARFSFRGSRLNVYEWNLDEDLLNEAFSVEKIFLADSR